MATKKRPRLPDDIIAATNALPFTAFLTSHFPASVRTFTPRPPATHSYTLSLLTTVESTLNSDASHILSATDLTSCLSLVERTSRADYEASSIGWHPVRKRREMSDADMRYLLARRADAETGTGIEGFCSFMFTHEDGVAVVYIYEIHLEAVARGCGLGARLLGLVEGMGRDVGVEKCMLTCFRRNERAVEWYELMGYGVDEYSPRDKVLRGGKVKKCDYLILSKRLKQARGGKKDMNGED